MNSSLRNEALEAAHAENREVAATADLWIREGFEPDELPYVIMQLARVNDYILSVVEAEETRLGRELDRVYSRPLEKFIGSYSAWPTTPSNASVTQLPPRTALD